MKSIRVRGEKLNELLGAEAEIYLDGKFNDDKMYTCFEDRSIQDEQGHECAYDFITDEAKIILGL